MARRRTAEAAETHSETLPEWTADTPDFHPGTPPQTANEHGTTAAAPSATVLAAESHAGEPSHAARIAAQREPAAEREPGDEPPRTPLPNPMSWITDTIAQVTFRTAREPYQAEIHFAEGKPSPEARSLLKEAGFRWNPQYEAWTRPIGYQTAAQDREIARRTATAVIQRIREEKGVPLHSPETAPDF